MKKFYGLIILLCSVTAFAQNYYSFSKSVQSYTQLTGTTPIINGAWTSFEKAVRLPFAFKLFNTSLVDSFYIDDWGTISVDKQYNGEISFIYDDLNSRAADKSEVSYVVDGITPNRIFKLQYNNAGLDSDVPMLTDSINVQVWIYETSNIIEIRFGSGKVAAAHWGGSGPFAGLEDAVNQNNYIIIQGDPANPVVNTTDIANATELTGLPGNGIVYRFTPAVFRTGFNSNSVQIKVEQHKLELPSDLILQNIIITSMSGQLIQMATHSDDINFSNFSPGVYILSVNSEQGNYTRKIIL